MYIVGDKHVMKAYKETHVVAQPKSSKYAEIAIAGIELSKNKERPSLKTKAMSSKNDIRSKCMTH